MNLQKTLLFLAAYLTGIGLIFTDNTVLMLIGFTLAFISLYKLTRKKSE